MTVEEFTELSAPDEDEDSGVCVVVSISDEDIRECGLDAYELFIRRLTELVVEDPDILDWEVECTPVGVDADTHEILYQVFCSLDRG